MVAQDSNPHDSLAFLAPGLLHQLGNLLLTIQGNAHCMGEYAAPRERQAILDASARGAATLGVLRHLLGDGTHEVQPADRLFRQVLELSRTASREAGHTLLEPQIDGAEAWPAVVAAPFVRTLVLALASFVARIPTGVQARIQAGLGRDGKGFAVRFDCRRGTGELPFPLPLDDLVRTLAIRLAGDGLPGQVVGRADGIGVSFAVAGGSAGVAAAGTLG